MKKLSFTLVGILGAIATIFLPPTAFAAIAFDNVASSTGPGVASSTFTISNFSCTNTNPLIVINTTVREDSTFANTPITAVTYNGGSATKNARVSNNPISVEQWYLAGKCDGAAHNVVISFTGAVTQMSGGVSSYTGVNQSTPFDVSSTNNQFAQNVTTTITTTVTNDILVDSLGHSGGFSGNTAGVNQTVREEATPCGNGSDCGNISSDEPATSAGTYTMSWTLNAGGFGRSIGHIIGAYEAAAAVSSAFLPSADITIYDSTIIMDGVTIR